jgi:hypothetical protein
MEILFLVVVFVVSFLGIFFGLFFLEGRIRGGGFD